MTRVEFVKRYIDGVDVGVPIYTRKIAAALAKEFELEDDKAKAATAVVVKRLVDTAAIPELKFFQNGIYFKTKKTPFGERGIDTQRVVVEEYIADNKGYETGISFLHRMGLTTQLPAQRMIATNRASDCARRNKKLDVIICPPKVKITPDNKAYLQTLDAIEAMDGAPVDAADPDEILANHIKDTGLNYQMLISLAYQYYSKHTVYGVARIAGKGNIV